MNNQNSPKLSVCFLVHANLQYAEIPSSETKNLVEKSYIQALEVFLKHPEIKVVMDFSGVTLEILAKDYPVVIEKLRELLKKGTVELCAGTYANPILPLIPLDHAKRQIEAYLKIHHRLFGDLKVSPKGFFPHEYFFDASMIGLFLDYDFEWIPVNTIQYINSLSKRFNNPLRPPLKQNELEIREYHSYELFDPIKVLGTDGKTISGVIISGEFYELSHDVCAKKMSWGEYSKLLDSMSFTHNDDGNAFLFLGPSDLEFIGYYAPPYSNRILDSISPENFEEFIANLKSKPNLEFKTPSTHLKNHSPHKQVYLKCGGDALELDYWSKDADNFRLNFLCQDASQKIDLLEIKLSLIKGQKAKKAKELIDQAWEALMLAENADGRGWMPIPERRLFCYEQALLALKKVEEAKKLLI